MQPRKKKKWKGRAYVAKHLRPEGGKNMSATGRRNKCINVEHAGVAHLSLHSSTWLRLTVASFLLPANQWEVSKSEFHQPGPVYHDFCSCFVSLCESGNVRCPAPNLSLHPFLPWALIGWGSAFLQGINAL